MILLAICAVHAQELSDYIAWPEAEVDGGSFTITLSDRDYDSAEIRRREPGETGSWTLADTVAELGAETSWTDPDFVPGEAWEYRIKRSSGSLTATAYLAGALDAPVVDDRGVVALVVEESVAGSLSDEIARLESDLVGDGWTVVAHQVSADDPPEEVKALLIAETGLEAAILLGHVPVPYSGNINPDGHSDHRGAWPADTYYADLDGEWTDTTVDSTSASREANHNVPGDGKFDQSTVPSEVEINVGRIDMFDLPAFELDEVELLRRYLDRDHAWRQGEVEAVDAVVIDDNFGTYAPGAFTGWLLSPVVGRDALEEGDLLTTLAKEPYLFGYGAGGGPTARPAGWRAARTLPRTSCWACS